jgi:hypothetical protein
MRDTSNKVAYSQYSGAGVPLPFLLFVVVAIAYRELSVTTTTASDLATYAADHW